MDGDAAADQAAHLVALAQQLQREGEDGLDLARVRLQVELARVRDVADEGVDAVAGDEGRGRRQRLADLDRAGVEADLLLGLAQRRRLQVGVAGSRRPPGKEISPAWRRRSARRSVKIEARLLRPAVEGSSTPRRCRRGPSAAASSGEQAPVRAQMITWTVPPSTDQAAPAT